MKSWFIICYILGHKWKYNFPSIPNKRVCKRCKKREGLNGYNLEWSETFIDNRTDDELIKKWVS
jgi:hypothetical protein